MLTLGHHLEASLVQSFAGRHQLPTVPESVNFLAVKMGDNSVLFPTSECVRHDIERDFAAIPTGHQPLPHMPVLHYLPPPYSRSSEEASQHGVGFTPNTSIHSEPEAKSLARRFHLDCCTIL